MEETDKFTTLLGNSEPSHSIQVKEPKKNQQKGDLNNIINNLN